MLLSSYSANIILFPYNFTLNFKSTVMAIAIVTFPRPALVLRDPELIGHVLVKAHRQHQMDRHNEPADSLGSRNLFSARGVRWRHLRTHLSPAFSGARMRRILSPIKSCAATLATTLGLVGLVRIRDLIARYSTDSVCACLYGKDRNKQPCYQ